MSIKLVMPSKHLILCHPLLLLFSIFPSIKVFPNESVLRIRWQKYWSVSFSVSPSNEYSGLISFGMDWLYLLAVQGTLESLLQYHSSKASILRLSTFFTVQLSHPYMTTGKTTALTRQTFVSKVTSLLFNMLSRLVIAFLPRSKCLFISWLQSPSAVILEPKKIKSVTISIVSLSICHGVMGPSPPLALFIVKVKVKSLSRVRLIATPWTVAYQAPPTMGFSRQEYWSGLPFPSPGDLPNPGIEPGSPAFQADALASQPPRGKHQIIHSYSEIGSLKLLEMFKVCCKWKKSKKKRLLLQKF